MRNLQFKIRSLLLLALTVGALFSCNTEIDNLDIQEPYTYSEKYYKNLRDYKASDHSISFMWFADYSSTQSMGTHFLGLPDSLDICSLWGGIPSDIDGKSGTFYSPKVYNEMRFVQKIKGVKMTTVLFPIINQRKDIMALPEEERVKFFGDEILKAMYDNDLDGIDLDYEIHGDWMYSHFTELVEYLGKYIGPKGKDSQKMLIIDFYGDYPPATVEPYVNYLVRQAYTQGFSEHNAGRLQNYYNMIKWASPEKFIVTENMGDYYFTGGSPFTEANGNQYAEDGERLYSLEGMARWNPIQGRKGGFGAFYGQRDYNNNPPYKYFRRGIQAQNPAIH